MRLVQAGDKILAVNDLSTEHGDVLSLLSPEVLAAWLCTPCCCAGGFL
jgi:hypothetical protein